MKKPSEEIKNKARLLLDAQAILGEGPIWDWKRNLLFWVDIEAGTLHAHNNTTQENRCWIFKEMIGAAIPTLSGKYLLALENSLASFDLEKELLTPLKVLENSDIKMRFNDGKVSPKGNFWIGSMHKEFLQKTGNLYQVSSDFKISVAIQQTTISNGMAWTSDLKQFYFIDSPTFEVQLFDYSIENDSISNRTVAFKIPKEFGSPDGMCLDEEGMLWIAHWGGSCIRRWNPESGKVLEVIEVPAPHVTSCCFGGKNLDTLYITTARSGLTKLQLEAFPLSGGLFQYTPSVKGKAIHYFKDN